MKLADGRRQDEYPAFQLRQESRARIPPFSYVFSAGVVLFGWAWLAVLTEMAPVDFYAPVRSLGVIEFNAALSILGSQWDGLLLLAASALMAATIFFGSRRLGSTGAQVISLLVVSLALLSLVVESAVVLPFLGLAGIALVLCSVRESPTLFGVRPRRTLSTIVVFGLATLAAMEVASAGRWLLGGADGSIPFSDNSWSASLANLDLSDLLYPILPRLALLFFASILIRLAYPMYRENLKNLWGWLSVQLGLANEPAPLDGELGIGRGLAAIILVVASATAAIVGLYPYLPAVNPGSVLVGVDVSGFYAPNLLAMYHLSLQGAVGYVFPGTIYGGYGDRPAYLLFQYLVGRLVASPQVTIRVLPALFAILTVITSYWFVAVGTRDRLLSVTVALVAAVSVQVTAGISGGLYANWLAVCEVFVFLALFLNGIRKDDYVFLFLAGVVSILVFLTHPWTWFLLVGLVAAFGVTSVALRLGGKDSPHFRTELIFVVSVLVLNLAPVLVDYVATGGSRFGLVASNLSDLSLANIPQVGSSLTATLTLFLAGAMGNTVMIVFSVVGVLMLKDLRGAFSRMLLCWVVVVGVAILLAPNPIVTSGLLQSRLVYLLPFQVFSSIGFLGILRRAVIFAAAPNGPWFLRGGLLAALAYSVFLSALLSFALQSAGYLYIGST